MSFIVWKEVFVYLLLEILGTGAWLRGKMGG